MPIISGNRLQKKEKIKAEISTEIAEQINEYCQWANIENVGYFIEEAACFVFSKDKDWKQYQKTAKKRKEATAV